MYKESHRLLRNGFDPDTLPSWLQDKQKDGSFTLIEEGELATHQAAVLDDQRVNWGDYLVLNEDGSTSAVRPDLFELDE